MNPTDQSVMFLGAGSPMSRRDDNLAHQAPSTVYNDPKLTAKDQQLAKINQNTGSRQELSQGMGKVASAASDEDHNTFFASETRSR